MLNKIKYYIIAFFAGISAVAIWILSRKTNKPLDTQILDQKIEDKKKHIEDLEKKEIKVEELTSDEVVDYWKK